MKLKLTLLTLTILLTTGLATADITFDHSGKIIFDTSTEFNDNVDLNDNILGFPTRNCPDGEAVTDVNDDGSVQCSEISGGGEAQNLSEVLDEDNTANQDIDMDGNEIIMLEAISAQDTDIRVDSELNLANNNITNLESLENFFNSACTADEAVTDIQNDGTLICNDIGSSEGEALNLSQVLEEGNIANQNIEFEEGIEIGDEDSSTDQLNSIAIGRNASAEGVLSTAIGENANSVSYSVALGADTASSNPQTVAVGLEASASDGFATALGHASNAHEIGSVAIGHQSTSNKEYTARFGSDSQAYDVDVTGDLSVGGHIENEGVRDIGYSTGHTAWEDGLDSEEVNRFGAASNEVIVVERFDVQLKGGGAETDFTVTLSDTAGNLIVQGSAGSVQNNVGETAQGEGLIVEVTNTAGQPVAASISLSGEVYDTLEVSTAD